MRVETLSMKKRVAALIAAGAFAASMAGMPLTAMAVGGTNSESCGEQVGSGQTAVTVQTVANEVGGSADPDNPNLVNISFTIPSAINFVAAADGGLTGPSGANAQIRNHSEFTIRVSSFDVDPENGWTIESKDAESHDAENGAAFQFGPDGHKVDAYDYLSKTAVADSAYEMMYRNGAVDLDSSGNIYNVSQDITSATRIAVVNTFVTQGPAPAQQA